MVTLDFLFRARVENLQLDLWLIETVALQQWIGNPLQRLVEKRQGIGIDDPFHLPGINAAQGAKQRKLEQGADQIEVGKIDVVRIPHIKIVTAFLSGAQRPIVYAIRILAGHHHKGGLQRVIQQVAPLGPIHINRRLTTGINRHT